MKGGWFKVMTNGVVSDYVFKGKVVSFMEMLVMMMWNLSEALVSNCTSFAIIMEPHLTARQALRGSEWFHNMFIIHRILAN